jgi:hypothetical protein
LTTNGLTNGKRPKGFQPGNKLAVGQKRGRHKTTEMMKTLVMDAAGDLGWDGKGKDGTRGWLRRQAKEHPRDYLKLMGKLMPQYIAFEMRTQINAMFRMATERSYESVAEARRALEEDGINVEALVPHLNDLAPRGDEDNGADGNGTSES